MKTIKCIVQIGCIWIAMNVYTQTVRCAKVMLKTLPTYVSLNEPMRVDGGRRTKDLSGTAADGFTDSVIIGVEIGNFPSWIGTLIRLNDTPGPSRENIDDVLKFKKAR